MYAYGRIPDLIEPYLELVGFREDTPALKE